jgi:dTDP-4-dehydrorhamnose reductase
MRVLVTGAGGLLGVELVEALKAAGMDVMPTTRADLVVSDPESVSQISAQSFGKLDWVVNCAAYTGVDKAESEPQLATDVNGLGPGYLSQVCSMVRAKLIHISTDFVFDGEATTPYLESARPNPLGAYGRSKLMGEQSVETNPLALVVRTSWLFGPRGNCFPKTILRAFDAGKTLRVVADQIGTPTYTPFLARSLVRMIETDPFPGIYHVAGPEIMSWHGFANLVLTACRNVQHSIEPILTEEWPTPAKRPKYSALDSERLDRHLIPAMPDTHKALAHFAMGVG